ncbi:hypothetical protein CSB69_0735 [Morganella morganii]|nr:hypothetical protein CSB69_0735 [Morganella morganii]EMP51202.1 hypothetical protein C790_01319 [Morganella morganii SC01]
MKKGVFTALSFDAKTTGDIKNHLLHKKQHMTSDEKRQLKYLTKIRQ